jgi:hypothetical protein
MRVMTFVATCGWILGNNDALGYCLEFLIGCLCRCGRRPVDLGRRPLLTWCQKLDPSVDLMNSEM